MTERTLGKRIGSGAASDVYEYGQGRVCKLYKPNAGNADYEYHKMKEAYEAGMPVPRPYEMVEIDGRRGFVMERVEGVSFLESMMNHLKFCHEKGMANKEIFDSELIQSQIRETASVLAELHSHPCGLRETDKLSLSNSCRYNAYLSPEEKEAVQEIISQLPEGDSMCHGDPNPGNLIRQDSGIRMIDWNNSIKGCFLYDIAEYVLTMRYADVSLDWPVYAFAFIREFQNEFSAVFMREYEKITRKDLSSLDAWTLPILVAKMAGNNPAQKQERLLRDIRHCLREL